MITDVALSLAQIMPVIVESGLSLFVILLTTRFALRLISNLMRNDDIHFHEKANPLPTSQMPRVADYFKIAEQLGAASAKRRRNYRRSFTRR